MKLIRLMSLPDMLAGSAAAASAAMEAPASTTVEGALPMLAAAPGRFFPVELSRGFPEPWGPGRRLGFRTESLLRRPFRSFELLGFGSSNILTGSLLRRLLRSAVFPGLKRRENRLIP